MARYFDSFLLPAIGMPLKWVPRFLAGVAAIDGQKSVVMGLIWPGII